MSIAAVRNLVKTYPEFSLKEVSFSLEEGRITGFVGRNGAGKTTVIKSMLNLVHPDAGEVMFFDMPMNEKEAEIKKRIGYSTGSVNWYPRKKLKDIIAVTRSFYDSWDEAAYHKYLKFFELDENKCPIEMSEGMKVKCNLLIALSHRAEILILDEPTSGLDPFSRDELLSLFEEIKKTGVSIFFSTHIVSDLEKCADNIVFISQGRIIASTTKDEFVSAYSMEGESLEQTIIRMEKEPGNP